MAVEVRRDRVVVAPEDLVGVVGLVAQRVRLAERHVADCEEEELVSCAARLGETARSPGSRAKQEPKGGRKGRTRRVERARDGGSMRGRDRKREPVGKGAGDVLIQARCPARSARSSSCASQVKMPFGSQTGTSES